MSCIPPPVWDLPTRFLRLKRDPQLWPPAAYIPCSQVLPPRGCPSKQFHSGPWPFSPSQNNADSETHPWEWRGERGHEMSPGLERPPPSWLGRAVASLCHPSWTIPSGGWPVSEMNPRQQHIWCGMLPLLRENKTSRWGRKGQSNESKVLPSRATSHIGMS